MKTGSSRPKNLIAGDYPIVTEWLATTGGNLGIGTVVTRNGAAMASGGDPYGILAEDVLENQKTAAVYLSGEFSENHLRLANNGKLTRDDVAKLRLLGIFVKKTMAAVDTAG